MRYVYRIVTFNDWENIQHQGCIVPAEVDVNYMHLSTLEYLEETATLYFHPTDRLLALEIDSQRLVDSLLYEPVESRNNANFPHYYGRNISMDCVIRAIPLNFVKGFGFQLDGVC